jgi:AraC-like DNA-binding protein
MDLLAWMTDNVKGDLSVASLARRAAMSPRNFARVFTREVGETPARHIENIRLEAARRQLETTSLSVDEVADTSGFRSAEILRRTFTRRLGVSPGRYRTAFRTNCAAALTLAKRLAVIVGSLSLRALSRDLGAQTYSKQARHEAKGRALDCWSTRERRALNFQITSHRTFACCAAPNKFGNRRR